MYIILVTMMCRHYVSDTLYGTQIEGTEMDQYCCLSNSHVLLVCMI